ncbi:unnamed protein product [Dracunculus medinensis]|uniref:DNA-directed DNA polymerase n=1 Tax=Dracunculus medinensis TaxID=318479 RepID=A0A0N4UGT0_DRAME|nr:unnamed protein product [Dracunculus medinensis]
MVDQLKIPNVQKLLGQFKGKAKMVVSHNAVTDENYLTALNTLKNQYGQRENRYHLLLSRLNVTTVNAIAKNEDIEQFWCLERVGIEAPSDMTSDNHALKRFSESVEALEDGRYEVELPWKTNQPKLPNNLGEAF